MLLNLKNINSFDIIKRLIFSHGLVLDTPYHLTLKQPTVGLIGAFPILKQWYFWYFKKEIERLLFINSKSESSAPSNAKKLRQNFNLTEELKLAFALPHKVAYEPYLKAFWYKILNSILYINKKLFKIGYSERDKCTFCDNESETLDHLFFHCTISNTFWINLKNTFLH